MQKRACLSDFRFWFLLAALLAAALSFIHPSHALQRPVYRLAFVVDITRSMNVEDYRDGRKSWSRLAYVKRSLREVLRQLPCQSEVGLGVFTERRTTLLFQPVEVCSGRAELDASIDRLDWRMAWAADSRIAAGLLDGMQWLAGQDGALVFITDGQEAPPLNPRYRSDFSAVKGRLPGLIVGVGALQASPIPKFDPHGRRIGVYGPDDVPHRSSFGMSELDPAQIEGYDARNAPFGKQAAAGGEHLSALQEGYLQQLAAETGLGYRRLQAGDDLLQALQQAKLAHFAPSQTDIRPYYAAAALLLLILSLL